MIGSKYLIGLAPCIPGVHVRCSDIVCRNHPILASGFDCHVTPFAVGGRRKQRTELGQRGLTLQEERQREFHINSPTNAIALKNLRLGKCFHSYIQRSVSCDLPFGTRRRHTPKLYPTTGRDPRDKTMTLTAFDALPWRAGPTLNPRIPWSGT